MFTRFIQLAARNWRTTLAGATAGLWGILHSQSVKEAFGNLLIVILGAVASDAAKATGAKAADTKP